jgi:hypothetical protein
MSGNIKHNDMPKKTKAAKPLKSSLTFSLAIRAIMGSAAIRTHAIPVMTCNPDIRLEFFMFSLSIPNVQNNALTRRVGTAHHFP